MTILIPESRLVSVGPGQMIDSITGSGVSVQKSTCGYPNLRVNNPQTAVMRHITWEAWVNRCVSGNRVVQIARISAKAYVLVGNFPAGSDTIEVDSVIDPDNTIICKPGNVKGMFTKSFDIASSLGYSPEALC